MIIKINGTHLLQLRDGYEGHFGLGSDCVVFENQKGAKSRVSIALPGKKVELIVVYSDGKEVVKTSDNFVFSSPEVAEVDIRFYI